LEHINLHRHYRDKRESLAFIAEGKVIYKALSICSTGFGECLNDEPNHNLASQYQFSDYPPTIDRRRSANLYEKGPVYQKLPGSAYTADKQCAQTFEHETRRCPYMVSSLLVLCIFSPTFYVGNVFTCQQLFDARI